MKFINHRKDKKQLLKDKKLRIRKVNPRRKIVIALWILLAASFSFAVFKYFTAIDTHTIHETKIIEKEYTDTHNVENFVEKFAKAYYSWEQYSSSIDNRNNALKKLSHRRIASS